jgi:cytochrome c553
MTRSPGWRRPLALGLAAVALYAGVAAAQSMSVEERITLCGTCHGEDGNSRLERIPSLAGQPEFFVTNQLILMREGVRKVEVMAPFVKDLTDDVIVALAKHYAGLAAKPSDEPIDQAKVKRGALLADALRCTSCHKPDLSGQDQMPRLAKQRIDYMTDAMKAYRDDKRTGADTTMTAVVLGVSDPDLEALAHYAAGK